MGGRALRIPPPPLVPCAPAPVCSLAAACRAERLAACAWRHAAGSRVSSAPRSSQRTAQAQPAHRRGRERAPVAHEAADVVAVRPMPVIHGRKQHVRPPQRVPHAPAVLRRRERADVTARTPPVTGGEGGSTAPGWAAARAGASPPALRSARQPLLLGCAGAITTGRPALQAPRVTRCEPRTPAAQSHPCERRRFRSAPGRCPPWLRRRRTQTRWYALQKATRQAARARSSPSPATRVTTDGVPSAAGRASLRSPLQRQEPLICVRAAGALTCRPQLAPPAGAAPALGRNQRGAGDRPFRACTGGCAPPLRAQRRGPGSTCGPASCAARAPCPARARGQVLNRAPSVFGFPRRGRPRVTCVRGRGGSDGRSCCSGSARRNPSSRAPRLACEGAWSVSRTSSGSLGAPPRLSSFAAHSTLAASPGKAAKAAEPPRTRPSLQSGSALAGALSPALRDAHTPISRTGRLTPPHARVIRASPGTETCRVERGPPVRRLPHAGARGAGQPRRARSRARRRSPGTAPADRASPTWRAFAAAPWWWWRRLAVADCANKTSERVHACRDRPKTHTRRGRLRRLPQQAAPHRRAA